LVAVRTKARPKTREFTPRVRSSSQQPRVRNPEYDPRVAPIATQIVEDCGGIIEECRQARYWYLKGALQRNANVEVNHDKSRVEEYLKSLGFSGPLLEALNVAEQNLRDSATPFELKNSLGHLRSFLEGLHEWCMLAKTAMHRWSIPVSCHPHG
jgi:hypothetical protein